MFFAISVRKNRKVFPAGSFPLSDNPDIAIVNGVYARILGYY